jgi:hypothetical protein
MLKSYHVDDALERIKQSEHGAHHLIVYQDLGILRQLYTKYVKIQLEQENKTVLMLPHYETVENLKRNLLPSGNVKRYGDSLILMDSIKGLFDMGNHMAFVYEQVKRAKNGVSVIADGGPFFHLDKRDKLVEHELSMPSQFDVNLKRFCVFHKRDFDRLTEEQIQKLINHHGQAMIIEN